MREPVCWLLNYPRPIGLEPTIYLTKPNPEEGYEDDESPFEAPTIIECYSYTDALSRILHFNLILALTEFKIVK